jgi:hypothetical protein
MRHHTVQMKTPLSSIRQNVSNNNKESKKCSGVLTKHPTQVARRNARERNRVREVSAIKHFKYFV